MFSPWHQHKTSHGWKVIGIRREGITDGTLAIGPALLMKARTGSHHVMIEGNILSAIGPETVGELNTTIIGTEVEIEIANTIAAENTIETVITITMGTEIEIEIATKSSGSSEIYHPK